MADLITLAGSPSPNSRSTALLEYTRRVAEAHGLRTAAISVRNLPAEDLLHGRSDSPDIQSQAALLRHARAVIIATPIYKAAYSGILKSFLDLLPPRTLDGKLVLPIGTGGSPLHALALDYALLPVLAALGSQQTLNSIYLTDAQIQLGEGGLQLDPPAAERLDSALRSLIDRLG